MLKHAVLISALMFSACSKKDPSSAETAKATDTKPADPAKPADTKPAEAPKTGLASIAIPRAGTKIDQVLTGGQPTDEHLKQAKEQGVKLIVNLRSEAEKAEFEGQDKLAAELGMKYVHIPIDGATGAVRRAIDVPQGLSVAGLALTDPTGFWLAVRVNAADGRALAAFGTRGGLLRLDRRTAGAVGPFIPTGAATGVVGAIDDDVWLADFTRTVTRVAIR